MPNERLRDAMHRNRLTPTDLATTTGVDPKTVERWITQDRIPYPRHRHALAAQLGESQSYLWPDAVPKARAAEATQSELVAIYPRRAMVPAELWRRLLTSPTRQLSILVYAGLAVFDEHNTRGHYDEIHRTLTTLPRHLAPVAADAAAIALQKTCPVMDEALGSMGAPLKVTGLSRMSRPSK